MPWFSILPSYLTIVETWIIRFFLLLAIIIIGPWVAFLIYDIILYTVRALAYEIPYYGGRARGRRRPRAPSLVERPNGRKRTFSISGGSGNGSASDDKAKMVKRREVMDGVESSGDEVDVTEEESGAIRSTDLWDAGTDSRFRSGADVANENNIKKRR
ncbi:hypothetical protein N7G274_001804 [Stereocaulon virgatum]|uniref:Uncharacterized protein n=1 Tax=Stereocaulon virgatum TaxID=373712 RepID=A0ABR4AKR5_9LECA